MSEEFDLAAATWRHDAKDEGSYIRVLAEKLENALPDLIHVTRHRKLFSKIDELREIHAKIDNIEFKLKYDAATGIYTTKGKVVRGICLKTDEVGLTDWLTDLSKAITTYSANHAEGHDNLETFLMH